MSSGQSPTGIMPALGTVSNPLPAVQVPPSSSQSTPSHQLHTLQRRIDTLELQNTQLLNRIQKKPIQTLTREGRAVRRLVALVEPIADMVAESDRRQLQLEQGVSEETIRAKSNPEQECSYNNYKALVHWCPTVLKLLEAGEFDLLACREVQTGADGARGDDTATLKSEIIHWIMENRERIGPQLSSQIKQGRGFNHNLTGDLLCPIDYDWGDPSVRAAIRAYHPDFRVTAFSWPRFLYENHQFNPSDLTKGLFQGELLVKAFKCIFTSPKSARRHEGGERALRAMGPSLRSRNHVAALLRMKSVQPQAIAYIAVQVRFALSSAHSWDIVDEDFDYERFYYNIVEHFEVSSTPPEKAAEIKELLLWWNRVIFGRHNVTEYRPLRVETLSVLRSRK